MKKKLLFLLFIFVFEGIFIENSLASIGREIAKNEATIEATTKFGLNPITKSLPPEVLRFFTKKIQEYKDEGHNYAALNDGRIYYDLYFSGEIVEIYAMKHYFTVSLNKPVVPIAADRESVVNMVKILRSERAPK